MTSECTKIAESYAQINFSSAKNDDQDNQESSSEQEQEANQVTKTKTSEEEKKKKKKAAAANGQKLLICLKDCRYAVIKRVARKMDFKFVEDENADWDIYWSDIPV